MTVNAKSLLDTLGISGDPSPGGCAGTWLETSGPVIESVSPTTGIPLGRVRACSRSD